MKKISVYRPTSIEEAIQILSLQGNDARWRADWSADETGGDRRIRSVGEKVSHARAGREDDLVARIAQRIHAGRRPVAGSLVPVSARRLLLLAQWRIHLLWRHR